MARLVLLALALALPPEPGGDPDARFVRELIAAAIAQAAQPVTYDGDPITGHYRYRGR